MTNTQNDAGDPPRTTTAPLMNFNPVHSVENRRYSQPPDVAVKQDPKVSLDKNQLGKSARLAQQMEFNPNQTMQNFKSPPIKDDNPNAFDQRKNSMELPVNIPADKIVQATENMTSLLNVDMFDKALIPGSAESNRV